VPDCWDQTGASRSEGYMGRRRRLIETHSETPPYLVMQACEPLGFHTPLQVTWHQLIRFPGGPGGVRRALTTRLWDWFFGQQEQKETTCRCGQPLPGLQSHTFKVLFEPETQYRWASVLNALRFTGKELNCPVVLLLPGSGGIEWATRGLCFQPRRRCLPAPPT